MGDTVDIYSINGDATVAPLAQYSNTSVMPFFAPADYTGDGSADAAYVEVTGGGLVWDFPSSSAASSRQQEIFGKRGDAFISGCYFDQDQFADRVAVGKRRAIVQTTSGGQIRLQIPGLRRGRQFFCADTDGDGVDELLVNTLVRKADGTVPTITQLKSVIYSVAIDSSVRKIKRARLTDRLTAFDINGDGADEIGLYRVGTSTLKVLISGQRRPLKLILPTMVDVTGATLLLPSGATAPGLLISDTLGYIYRFNFSTLMAESVVLPPGSSGLLVQSITMAR